MFWGTSFKAIVYKQLIENGTIKEPVFQEDRFFLCMALFGPATGIYKLYPVIIIYRISVWKRVIIVYIITHP